MTSKAAVRWRNVPGLILLQGILWGLLLSFNLWLGSFIGYWITWTGTYFFVLFSFFFLQTWERFADTGLKGKWVLLTGFPVFAIGLFVLHLFSSRGQPIQYTTSGKWELLKEGLGYAALLAGIQAYIVRPVYKRFRKSWKNNDPVADSGSGAEDLPNSISETATTSLTKRQINDLYEHPEILVDMEFANRTDTLKNIWIEPACVSIELDAATEYRIVTHDRTFRIEFDENNQVIFYLQYSFGFRLFKRACSTLITNPHAWILETDLSDIN